MNIDRHWNDESLIDDVLHKLPPEQAQQLHAHIRTCNQCLRHYEKWQTLLNTEPNTSYELNGLKQRLMHSVSRIDKREKTDAPKSKKMLVGFSLATIATAALLFLQLQPIPQNDITTIQDDSVEEATFIHDSHTIHYDVTPVMKSNVRGRVWVNDLTKEMLIRIEGLTPMVHKDYQMWFIDSDQQLHGKVLELQNGKAVLYLNGDGIEHIRHVRTSVEPKGGSPFPTGADTFIVELER